MIIFFWLTGLQGGNVIGEKRGGGKGGHYCLVQDPAGAYLMIAG